MSESVNPLWMTCPVCQGLMLMRPGKGEPECDRCKQSLYIHPREVSETNH